MVIARFNNFEQNRYDRMSIRPINCNIITVGVNLLSFYVVFIVNGRMLLNDFLYFTPNCMHAVGYCTESNKEVFVSCSICTLH